MKRTALAGKSGLQYNALIRYIEFLETLRWVESIVDSGTWISITTIGRSFRKLLDRDDNPSEISEEILDKLSTQTHGLDLRSQREERGEYARDLTKTTGREADSGRSQSCLFCGNIIKKHVITKEIDGEKYSFDKRECATLFVKFRDIYGREFFS